MVTGCIFWPPSFCTASPGFSITEVELCTAYEHGFGVIFWLDSEVEYLPVVFSILHSLLLTPSGSLSSGLFLTHFLVDLWCISIGES
ncbi:hypothetical protein V6N13_083884 [Hibiscus sabdariffa]|uniref:Uncharacterized protein n=1 Tax=Hibiscus sabdariffa TaxID=183260 RepID=A0ABR2SZD6_9ROSI